MQKPEEEKLLILRVEVEYGRVNIRDNSITTVRDSYDDRFSSRITFLDTRQK